MNGILSKSTKTWTDPFGASGYETYDTNPHTGQFTPEKRFRGEGGPHGNVDPPFVLERKPGKGPGSTPVVPRPATPGELPNGY